MVLDVAAAQYDRSGDENTWNYGGEEYWATSHSKAALDSPYDCAGIKQSPININNSMVQDLYFYNQLSLADYDAKYALQQFHFHWGSSPDIGSEHTIDGIAFPMEIHLVHKKTDYASVGASLDYNDGLAVIGIMFQVADTSDDGLKDIIDAAQTIVDSADQFTEKPTGSINMSTFLYQTGRSYYYYKGSLTTPPCTETVDWHVMEGAIRITEADLEVLRKLTYKDGAPMVDNYRNTLPLNNRIIKRVFN